MNPPNDPSNPPPLPTFDDTLPALLDALLKRPALVLQRFRESPGTLHWLRFALVALLAFALYGLVVGSFSGGVQWLAAPVKVAGGALVSALICFPSLYIFASLSGADGSLRTLAGVLFAMLTLTGLLLLGFVPVAWVFSQSTESVVFIGALHLLFWFIAACFGLRLLRTLTQSVGVGGSSHLRVWAAMFLLVGLQMTTALRPIVGTSPDWLPREKKFFLAYWFENLDRRSTGE